MIPFVKTTATNLVNWVREAATIINLINASLNGWKDGYFTPGARAMKYWRQIVTTANDPVNPEIADYIEMNQTVTSTGPTSTYYKIMRAGLLKSTVTVPEVYGLNDVVEGKFGPGFGFCYGHEVDINNLGANADTIGGGAQTSYGYLAAAGGVFRNTAGFATAGYFDYARWSYGFASFGLIQNADYFTSSNATIGLDIRGTKSIGVDTQSCTSMTYAIMLKNNLPIAGLTTTPTAVNLIKINTSNRMELGDAALGYIQTNQSIVPSTANTWLLGTGALPFEDIYCHHTLTVTSDPATKLDITPITVELAQSIFSGFTPISYRHEVGGTDVEVVEEDGEVEEYYMVQDGFECDDLPPEQKPFKKRPKFKTLTRMAPGKVKRVIATPREGKRTQLGLNASEVGSHLKGLGFDCGMYVRANGIDMLRIDQNIPLLIVMVKMLDAERQIDSARIKHLEERLAELIA